MGLIYPSPEWKPEGKTQQQILDEHLAISKFYEDNPQKVLDSYSDYPDCWVMRVNMRDFNFIVAAAEDWLVEHSNNPFAPIVRLAIEQNPMILVIEEQGEH